jgi:hypothetical protein
MPKTANKGKAATMLTIRIMPNARKAAVKKSPVYVQHAISVMVYATMNKVSNDILILGFFFMP